MSQNVSISAERYEVDTEAPLTNFSHCHIGILHQIDRLSSLPDLLGPAMLAKRIAAQSLEYFHHGMHAHHQEEEKELFPAVQDSAQVSDVRPARAPPYPHRHMQQIRLRPASITVPRC